MYNSDQRDKALADDWPNIWAAVLQLLQLLRHVQSIKNMVMWLFSHCVMLTQSLQELRNAMLRRYSLTPSVQEGFVQLVHTRVQS